jgi:DNA-binding NarL/FixJ family response regulator
LSIRKGLSQLFGREADFKVCAEAQNGREAVEKALQFRPDLIVLDLSMPVMNGLDAAQELKQLMPSVPLIMFTSYASPSLEAQTLMAGISALVSKSQHAAILVSTARSLLTPRAA